MPAHRKDPDRRQRSASSDLAPATGKLHPVPMTEWSPAITALWQELWGSPLARYFTATDVPSLRRLFTLRSRLVAAYEKADAEPVLAGSTGQTVLSPWFQEAHRLEGEIQKLEDRFGLTPQARLRLGVQFEEGVSLAARNRELLEAYRNGEA